MTKIHVNVGHMHKASPRELVGAITGETGISSRNIGAISIQKGFSLVEISSDLAEDVMTVLNKGVFIAGTRVVAKMDSGRPAPPRPRKPGAAVGSRRQPPARYTKKPRGFLGDRDD